MKDFKDFRNSLSDEKILEICNSRVEKIAKAAKDIEFDDSNERFIWSQRSQMIGFIFDFLEEYHKWLNS